MKDHVGGESWASNPANLVYLVLLGLCIAFATSARGSSDNGLQFYLMLFLVLPAFILAFTDSKFLLPYIIAVWALGPEVRRVVDWSEGHFQPVTLLSLVPLLATTSIIIPVVKRHLRMTKRLRTALSLFGVALLYGLIVGLTHNGLACLYDLANYVLPLMILLYAVARQTGPERRDFWISAFANIATAVAVYGWIQFLFAPAWDVFWMRNAPIASIGSPEPLKIRVFSTLNSPGPAAELLAAALAPMFLEKRWRGGLGWAGVGLVASALAITLVRSSWLMLLVTLAVYILLSPGKDRQRKVLTVSVIGLTLFALIPFLPGGGGISARVQTLGNLKTDRSANARSEFATDFIPKLLGSPLGLGLGTVGQGSKIDNGGKLGEYAAFDNGFYAIFITFGILGGTAMFAALWTLGKAIRALERTQTTNIYTRLGIATLASVTCGLISANMLTGIGGVLMWLLIGTAFQSPAPIKSQSTQVVKP